MKPIPRLKRGPKILRQWLNDLRAAVNAQRILRAEGYEVHEHINGSQLVFDPVAADTPPNGTTPYILGSTNYGSDPAGPGGTAGPWGGSGDIQSGDGSSDYADTWHRDRKPLTPGDVQTDSVEMALWRYYDIDIFTRQIFYRTAIFDSRGLLSISAEINGPIVANPP